MPQTKEEHIQDQDGSTDSDSDSSSDSSSDHGSVSSSRHSVKSERHRRHSPPTVPPFHDQVKVISHFIITSLQCGVVMAQCQVRTTQTTLAAYCAFFPRPDESHFQGPQFSLENLVKFSGWVCEIPRLAAAKLSKFHGSPRPTIHQ